MRVLDIVMGASFQLRHCPKHELIEQRYGECHVAMGRTIDHPFLDQACSHWADAVDLNAEGMCDVATTLRAGAQTSHRTQEAFLTGCKSVKTHTKETLIESFDHDRRCCLNNLQCDWGSGRTIPCLVTPFLQEVRIALCQSKDFFQRVALELHARQDRKSTRLNSSHRCISYA